MYNLDPEKVMQVQQDEHITKIIDKCKSKNDKTPYYWDEHCIREMLGMDQILFHAIIVPYTLQPYILYESHNALEHNGSSRLYHFIKRQHYWKKLCQHFNKYVCSCPEFQQITLKEPK